MTISAGDYLLGAYTADGSLVVIPSGIPTDGQYCVFARTGDHRRVAMLATPMRDEGAVGFLGTAADGLTVAFAPGVAGPALCIPVQSLGYGIPWMSYPPFSVNVNVTNVVAQPGRDAFIGAWADWLAGQPFGGGALTPEGIERNWFILNLNMAAQYPFLVANPHDLEEGAPAISLGGVVPAADDGVWFHAEPMPLVMSRRTCIGPGPLHNPPDWPFQPTPGTESMGLPMDVRSTRQLFTNLKAWLDFAPSGDIRLNLRMYVVVTVGRTADYIYAPPIAITGIGEMNCLPVDLSATGIGTACQALTATGGIPSLGCYCTCEAILLSQCAALDFGINALKRSNEYYGCGENPARRVRTIAIHGGDSREITAAWPYGQEPSDVTEARVLAAFGASGTINEWVATEFANRFGAAPLAIVTDADSEARLGTVIECDCTPTGISPTVPDELAGTQPLPTSDFTICFPQSGGGPVIPAIVLDNIDGWRGRLEDIFRYILTGDDARAAALNPDSVALLNHPTYLTQRWHAYAHICMLWSSWDGVLAAIPSILPNSALTDIPLRTDCFSNGVDPGIGEYVFGYDLPTTLFSDGSLISNIIDYAQDRNSLTLIFDHTLIPPRDNLADWVLVAQGGGHPGNMPQYIYPDCSGFPQFDPPECDEEPPPGLPFCDILDRLAYWHYGSVYPKYYMLRKPQCEIRVKADGCYLNIRVAYRNWLVRETTYWHHHPGGPHGSFYLADAAWLDPQPKPWLTNMGLIDIGRGIQVRLPFGFTDQSGAFDADGVLDSRWWTRHLGTGRLLGGCLATNPGYATIVGENALRVYL